MAWKPNQQKNWFMEAFYKNESIYAFGGRLLNFFWNRLKYWNCLNEWVWCTIPILFLPPVNFKFFFQANNAISSDTFFFTMICW